MKKFILKLFSVIFILLCTAIVCGYLYLNFIFIPKITPEINAYINSNLKQNISLSKIYFSPLCILKIKNLRVCVNKDAAAVNLECKNTTIETSYITIFNSWRKNNHLLHIPLKIKINDLSIKQKFINIFGKIETDNLVLKLHLKTFKPEISGNIGLKDFNINSDLSISTLKQINGQINIDPKNGISAHIYGIGAYNYRSKAHKQEILPAELNLQLTNLDSPELKLDGEMGSLTCIGHALIKDTNLLIKNINFKSNHLDFDLKGEIKQFKNQPELNLKINTNFNIEYLENLPFALYTKILLSQLKPKGRLGLNAEINWPIKNFSALSAAFKINSEQIDLHNYLIKNFSLDAILKKGILLIQQSSANILNTDINATATINLMDQNIPYKSQITCNKIILSNITQLLKVKPQISGTNEIHASVSGEIKNIDNLNLNFKSVTQNLEINDLAFPASIQTDAEICLHNSDLLIKKLSLNDSITTLLLKGDILNIYHPILNLCAVISCNAENLKNYIQTKSLPLKGRLNAHFKINGPISKIGTAAIPFTASANEFQTQEILLHNLELKGFLRNNQINLSSGKAECYNG
ncbi:MAG: hypothetical protein DRP78_07185, partial [Candidatus Omnitrophota bacterium]